MRPVLGARRVPDRGFSMTHSTDVRPSPTRTVGHSLGAARSGVVVGFVVNAVRAGIGVEAFAFMIDPMRTETGWTASSITLCITLEAVVAALVGPAVGRALDRHGARRILVGGLLANGLQLILVAQIDRLWEFAVITVLFGGVSQACIGNSLIMALVAKRTHRSPGAAMAVASAGANVGSLLVTPLLVMIMTVTGQWRISWMVIGLLPIALAPLVLRMLERSPHTLSHSPTASSVADQVRSGDSSSLGTTLRTPQFWLLMTIWNLADFAMKGSLINKIPYAAEKGFTLAGGLGVTVLYGVCAIVGKLCTGWLAERFSLTFLGATLAGVYGAALYLFIGTSSATVLCLSMGIVGGLASGGMIALMPIILARHFGQAHQGAISGVVIALTLLSSVGGPLSGSVTKDVLGSYRGGFLCYLVLIAIAGVLFVWVRRPVCNQEET